MPNRNFKCFKYINKFKQLAVDILFPKECLSCGRTGEWLCPGCLNRIKYNLADECAACRQPSQFGRTHSHCQGKSYLNGVIIAGQAEDKLLHSLIHKYKYNFVKDLAGPLAQILINKILILKQAGLNLLFSELIVAPVPLHRRRLRWRGFNQAELLARPVADTFGWIVSRDLIYRRKHTRPQMKLKRSKRLINIQDAFALDKSDGKSNNLSGKNVLLADDILTTGATMNECAKILKASGARQVWGLALSRG